MLKASAAFGLAVALPACGNADAEVFAGALTDPAAPDLDLSGVGSTLDPAPVPTTEPVVAPEAVPAPASAEQAAGAQPTAEPTAAEALPTATAEPTAAPAPTATAVPTVAVAGEMVIAFTYTQGVGGKNERPYVAVWIEDAAGELAETVSLWYQQQRRGERWLDHLDRWWAVDQQRISLGGVDDVDTISSATREPGSYTVAWNGLVDGVPAAPGRYFVCIESAREDGPYSLIREPFELNGDLAPTPLPDTGELSAAVVRIDV